jgi:hypothetical protein
MCGENTCVVDGVELHDVVEEEAALPAQEVRAVNSRGGASLK